MTPAEITEVFGERCAEFDAGCAGCQVWRQQDEIERLRDWQLRAADELREAVDDVAATASRDYKPHRAPAYEAQLARIRALIEEAGRE